MQHVGAHTIKKARKVFAFIAVICIRNWLIKMLNKRKYVQSFAGARCHEFDARHFYRCVFGEYLAVS